MPTKYEFDETGKYKGTRTIGEMLGAVHSLTRQDVEHIPDVLEPAILYVSDKYRTAIHLCACGCGNQTVTPLKEDGWTLDGLTLRPSIGNMRVCGAHYYVTDGRIEWL